MCGIVGAVADRDIVPILIEGLRRLDSKYGLLESHGRGKDAAWRLRAEVERRLTSDTSPTRSRRPCRNST